MHKTIRIRSLVFAIATTIGCATPDIIPGPAIVHHDAAMDYLNNGQCVQAEERCRLALEYGPRFAHAYNCLGLVALRCHGDLDEASQQFKDALSVNADFAEAHNNLGTVFFRRTPPQYGAACEQFLAALEIDPGYLIARENRGMCLMRQGTIRGDKGDTDGRAENYKEARSHLIRLLEMNPNNFNARHHLGLMDLLEKRYAAAEQNFKRCLEIDPENPVCSYNLGNTYLETSRCGDAIQAFITALRTKTASDVSVGARQNLGVAYELCARNDGAIKQFLDRIKLDPGNPTHHFDLGNIYAEKGLPDQAVNEWENTVKLDPLYCPAYYELAMSADKNLDTDKTIRLCQDFVACATEKNKDRATPQWPAKVGQCKQLVKKLQME
ncbi:MAG: tetratricopeptide repeat protein [Myxococcota bacterium]